MHDTVNDNAKAQMAALARHGGRAWRGNGRCCCSPSVVHWDPVYLGWCIKIRKERFEPLHVQEAVNRLRSIFVSAATDLPSRDAAPTPASRIDVL